MKPGKRAVQAHIKRLGLEGKVENGQDVPGVYKITYDVIGNPKVSILIPNKDGLKYLKPCIKSILKLTTYENYEIVIIENNSEKESTFKYYEKLKQNPKIKVLEYKEKEFNYSRIINFGVKNVDGDFVLQLNNDTKLITPNWLELFIGYAQQKDIGAVGARLYYKDKSIQHAGIAIGINGTAGNLLVNLEYGKHGYYGFEAITRNVSAVTGACLFAKRSIYKEVRIYGRK
jgi:glycosyltransferase involved in cell wall biosynthesis